MHCPRCRFDFQANRVQEIRAASPVLKGLEEISAYLRKGRKQVTRLIRAGQLALRQVDGEYVATMMQLDAWVSGQDQGKGEE